MNALPIVAIVGRPNVGKSTLFNRILGHRTAIVEDRARTTRDRLYGDAEWNGRRFIVVDTGGLELDPNDPIEAKVQEQARLAIAEADVIVLVVDAAVGITPSDEEAATILRRAKAPVLVAVNKADNERREFEGAEFHSLGWDETHQISAAHGRGTGDLLDAIVWALPPESEEELARKARENEADEWARDVAHGRLEPILTGLGDDESDEDDADLTPADIEARKWDAAIAADADRSPAAIAFVGRPNVGKSSLLNALLGEDRAIVSDVPGHDPRRDRHPARLGPQRDRPHRHGRDQAPRQGRVGSGGREVLDPPRAQGHRPGGRGDPRHRRRRGPDRPGRPRGGLRRRGGQGPRRRDQQVGPRRREDRQDVRAVRRVDPPRGAVPRLRPGHQRERQDRPADRPGPRGRRRHLGRAPPADLDGGAEPRPRLRHGTADCHRSSRAAARRSSTPPRRPWRRRRSCSSPTMRARSTSATGATSRTGCATRSGSPARRSASCSATGARSSCRAARSRARHPGADRRRADRRPRPGRRARSPSGPHRPRPAAKPATKAATKAAKPGKKSGPKPGLTRGTRPSTDRERRTP